MTFKQPANFPAAANAGAADSAQHNSRTPNDALQWLLSWQDVIDSDEIKRG